MKHVLFTLLSILSLSAFAQNTIDAQDLYEALNIPEQDVSIGEGVGTFEKKTAGLSCTKSQVVYPGSQPKYSCSIEISLLDAEEVYDALSIEAIDTSFGEGVQKFEKSIAGLKCSKFQVVYPGEHAKYHCKLEY